MVGKGVGTPACAVGCLRGPSADAPGLFRSGSSLWFGLSLGFMCPCCAEAVCGAPKIQLLGTNQSVTASTGENGRQKDPSRGELTRSLREGPPPLPAAPYAL